MHNLEIAVIGGGPAGLETAFELVSNNVDVTVFEEHSRIGIPLQCGEGVSANLIKEFPHLKKGNFFLREIDVTKLFFPNNKVIYGDIHALMIDRTKFDQYLAYLVEKEGGKIQTSCKVLAAKRSNSNIKLSVKTPRGVEYYKCNYLVIAEGARAKISSMLGFPQPRPLIKAYEYKIEGEWTETLDFYFDVNKYPYGYAWIFPRIEETNIGVVTTANNIAAILDRFLKESNIPKNVKQKIGGRIPMGGPISPLASENVVIVGDAAGMVNPIFYGGIRIGMQSAKMAANALLKALKNDKKDIKTNYEQELNKYPFAYKYNLLAHKHFYGQSNNFLIDLGSLFNNEYINRIEGLKMLPFVFKFLRYPRLLMKLRKLYHLYKGFKIARDWGF